MVDSKSVVLQMIPHTLFIKWDFWTLFTELFTSVLLFTTLFTSRWHCSRHYSLAVVKLLFTYTVPFMYTVLFTYTVLFIQPVISLNVHF